MQHENVFTQMDRVESPEGSPPSIRFKNTKLKVGWKSVCTLLCTIALTLECINVTLNAHCMVWYGNILFDIVHNIIENILTKHKNI